MRIFARHEVAMVVIGGVAAQIHGWKSATSDLDIAVDVSEGNVDRINRALEEAGAGPPTVGELGTAFQTKHGRLEIVRRADGIGQYADWARRARARDLGAGLVIVVADPEDVLISKRAAGRDKDHSALGQMRDDFAASGALPVEHRDEA